MFTHLHTHSHYSLLDGLPKIPELIKRAKTLGMTALAITDHGNMYGAIEFYKAATSAGIKPIIGIEAYITSNLYEKQGGTDSDLSHLILLAYNITGYHNLIKLVTISNLEGFYYKPRLDKNVLKKYSEGLICLSGCLNGEIAKLLLADKFIQAQELAYLHQDIFGADNFYLEIQGHLDSLDQIRLNNELIKLSKQTSIPLVATQDSHYLLPEDREAQDVMVCINTGKTINDPNRLNMSSMDLSFISEETIREIFKDLPEAIDNTNIIADRIELYLDFNRKQWLFPNFEIPNQQTPGDYLKQMSYEGLKNKNLDSKVCRDRVDYELDIIIKKGYATYFLVVSDFVNWSRQQGIINTTRGSAAGSFVGYLIGITNLNPLTYQLPFERFLNMFRPLPPDIDMDFADVKRDEVINYIIQKYGKDRVARIVTFGTLMPKAAIRDIVRVLGYPYSFGDKLSKMVPLGKHGMHMTVDEALRVSSELAAWYKSDNQVQRVLDLAKKIEGCVRHASTHAAGTVISAAPLIEHLPLQKEAAGEDIVSQYDMHAIEAVGLVKFDILGIRNLSILGYSRDIIKSTTNITVDLDNIPIDDKPTYDYLAQGHTLGLFQLGSAGMTRYLKALAPNNIFDIMAMVALFRPGPMDAIPDFIKRKHNKRLVKYLDPRLEPILKTSYGVITYQDDVLFIAIELAGYTWEEADKLRKAIGKKIPKEMQAQKEKFLAGCLKHKVKSDIAEKIWQSIEPFAAYGFNKAHAASYALIAYATAYLKAHWTTQFMTAVLTAEAGNIDKVSEAINECEDLGIKVLPPDVNESCESFTYINDKTIRFGLLAIKNLGDETVISIIAERNKGDKFKSLTNLLQRIDAKGFNRKTLEGLIKSGALDTLADRGLMISNLDKLLQYHKDYLKDKESKQESLFDWLDNDHSGSASDNSGSGDNSKNNSNDAVLGFTSQPEVQITKQEKLAWEKEFLGLYISAHPFMDFYEIIKNATIRLIDISNYVDGAQIIVAGILSSVKKIITKKNEQMLFAKLADKFSEVEVVVFPKILNINTSLWNKDNCVIMKAEIFHKDDEVKLTCISAYELSHETVNQALVRLGAQG